jgi:cell division protein FtsB
MNKTQNLLKTKVKKYLKYFLLALGVIFLISLVRNVFRISEAGKSIDEAKNRVDKLAEENAELKSRLQAVQSESYTEKQLRDKLGMAKEGETIVILPDTETIKKIVPAQEEEEEILPDPVWKRWLKMFY